MIIIIGVCMKKDDAEIFAHEIKRAAARKLWKDIEDIRRSKAH